MPKEEAFKKANPSTTMLPLYLFFEQSTNRDIFPPDRFSPTVIRPLFLALFFPAIKTVFCGRLLGTLVLATAYDPGVQYLASLSLPPLCTFHKRRSECHKNSHVTT
jgi:hypothetical protein